jgi:diamine N-acetyltransferase
MCYNFAMTIVMETVDQSAIDRLEPLWSKLILHHQEHAGRFKPDRHPVLFVHRKRELLKIARAHPLRIDFALADGRDIGYCVSAINEEGIGEIESLIIDKLYRGQGLGGQLMTQACRWMDDLRLPRKIVAVGEGNEAVFGFYHHYGFFPLVYTLAQIQSTVVAQQPVPDFEFVSAPFNDLKTIRPLWRNLARYEGETTPQFRSYLEKRSFTVCQSLIAQTAALGFHLDLVRQYSTQKVCGYCLTFILEPGLGRIESHYLEPACRGRGIGGQLMNRALDWLQDRHVRRIILMTATGNRQALNFYSGFNFYCRNTILQQI